MMEAPGTYHHSLVVANLAETAAYDIGADANLTRVGGYYHDIGKLKYPQFFAENQLGVNPHDNLDPRESVQMIINHVRFGIEMAAEYKLPSAVTDFIIMHHGTTLIQFFYHKAKEQCKEGETLNEADFRYPFVIPQNKETGILMLADTCEAAVRAMIKEVKDFGEVEKNIRRLIRMKLDDGQLEESGLTVGDLEKIAKAFVRVFRGMYHERVKYPEEERKAETDGGTPEGEVSPA
jgi:putative nucleotidyltransferase with HDIG domain